MNAVATATWLLALAKGYLALGLAFAFVFVVFLVKRMDPGAEGASLGFRIIVIPGVALLWPLLLWRTIRRAKTPVECNAHRAAVISPDSLVKREERR